MKTKLKLAPFIVGNMVEWWGGQGEAIRYIKDNAWHTGKIEWRENAPFRCSMKIDRSFRGRSAAGMWMTNPTGSRYVIRLRCLLDLLTRGVVHEGVSGNHEWQIIKQGANYSLMLVNP